jgi:Cu/Ag efflux protein CusF
MVGNVVIVNSGLSAAAWLQAAAAVVAAATTIALVLLARAQMRSATTMADAATKQAEATAMVARLADQQQTIAIMHDNGWPFATPDQTMAMALTGIAQSLGRAYPAPNEPVDPDEDEPDPDAGL